MKNEFVGKNCPCGTGLLYEKCCGLYHSGKEQPQTAEKLMRSRYCAYVVGQVDYIAKTNDPETGGDFDAEAAETWAKESKWLGLEIIAANEFEVEFKANFEADGKKQTHHEVSLFRRDKQGVLYYRDGKVLREPERRAEPKVGRNDPCTCGSGKKYKKCCAA